VPSQPGCVGRLGSADDRDQGMRGLTVATVRKREVLLTTAALVSWTSVVESPVACAKPRLCVPTTGFSNGSLASLNVLSLFVVISFSGRN